MTFKYDSKSQAIVPNISNLQYVWCSAMILQNCKCSENAFIIRILSVDNLNFIFRPSQRLCIINFLFRPSQQLYISDFLLRPSQCFDSFQNLEKQGGGYLHGGGDL